MKTSLKTLVAAALVTSGGSFVTAETASAFVVREKKVVVGHRGPIRDTMYRWHSDPYGYRYGYYPPRYYPGMYWGGYHIYSRPIYVGSYASCGWARIVTPWGPRWRPVCV